MLLTTPSGETFKAESYGRVEAKSAVLLLHDWWGLQPYNREWAERLAEAGFRVLLVDLYDGHQPQSAAEAGEWMRNLNQPLADGKLLTALSELKRHHSRIAVLGWSFGGLQAQYAAQLDPQAVNATIFFYSRVLTDSAQLTRLTGPVLGIFSETECTWPEKQRHWESAMQAAGTPFESYSFEADHGFVNKGGERYNETAAEAGWRMTLDFLQRVL